MVSDFGSARERFRQLYLNQTPTQPQDKPDDGLFGIDLLDDTLGYALNQFGEFTRRVEETPVPGGPALNALLHGDIGAALWLDPKTSKYSDGVPRLGDPKRITSTYLRENVPGVPGRVAASTAEVVLDPLNILGLGIAGKGMTGARAVATELLGRGSMSVPRYAATLGLAGAGAGIGQEIAGRPGALLAGFAAPWAGLSAMSRIRAGARRGAGRASAEAGRIAENTDFGEVLRTGGVKSRFEPVKLPDGTDATLVTQKGLLEQMNARKGLSSRVRSGQQTLNDNATFDINTWDENTNALDNLYRYMTETGRQELTVAGDAYDVGRKLGYMYQAQGDALKAFPRAEQAALDLAALEDAASRIPELRFRELQSGTPRQLFQRELPKDVEPQLAQISGLRQQQAQSAQSITQAKQAVAQAKSAYDNQFKSIIDSLPSGAKSAGRRYMSALITGEGSDEALSLLRSKVDIDPAVFDNALQLHQARKAAEQQAADLAKSAADLDVSVKDLVRQSDDAIARAYGTSAKSLSRKIIQFENRPGDYRLNTFTVQDGKLHMVLDRITPKSTARAAIEAGAEFDVAADEALKAAQTNLDDLLRQRQAARQTGKTAEAKALSEQVKEARAVVARHKTPARPVPIEQLPRAERRLVVPIDADVNMRVFEPQNVTPSRLVEAGFTDARTVKLLNTQTRLKLEADTLTTKIEQAQDELTRIASESNLTEAEQILLSQGVIDGVRPEAIKALQDQARLRESLDLWQNELDMKLTDLAGIEDTALRSAQTLEATLNQARLEKQLADESLARAEADYARYQTEFEQSLQLGTNNIATRELDMWKSTQSAISDMLKGDLPKKRLSEAALDRYQAAVDAVISRNRSTFPKPQQEELARLINGIERLIPHQGLRASIRQMVAPHMRSEMWIDPDALRTGPAGFVNRNILGRGFNSPEFEGAAGAYLDGRAAAGHIADLTYGGEKIFIDRYIADRLKALGAGTDETAAWARTMANLSPEQQTRRYLRSRAKPMESREWKTVLEPARAAGATEPELKAIYDFLSDEFTFAARHQDLFNIGYKGGDDTTLSLMMNEWGKNLRDLENVTKSRELPATLLKREFREAAPKGRLLQLDGTSVDLKNRNVATDMLEIIRNASSSNKNVRLWLASNVSLPEAIRNPGPAEAFSLDRIFIDKADWAKTIPANLLEKLNKDGTFEYSIKPKLKDPSQVDKLKRGQPIARTEWLKPEYADDWTKMRSFMMQDNPTGMWATVEDVRRAVQRVVGSILIGDMSFGTIQFGFLAALSPTAAGRAIARARRAALSDEGFMAWYTDPDNFDFVTHAMQNGLGVGSGTIFGGQRPGNVWEMVPGLRKLGRGLNAMDSIMFDRGMFITKVEALKTNLETVNMLKAMGRETSQTYIDNIPVLKDLHSAADFWQSSNEEIYRAAIRLTNNQFGGLPQSQSLVSPDRQRVESILFMVPGFFRARAGLINQASRALRNPGSVEGLLASSILAREAAFRLAFAGTIATLSGTQDKFAEEVESWAALDPRRSGGILSGPLGDGGYLGLSWGNQAPKLYGQMLLGFREGEFNLNPADRVKAVKEFMTGRQNPVLRAVVEQYEGKDFFGRPLASPADRAVAMSQAILPIWGAEAAEITKEQLQKDGEINVNSLAAQTGAEFLGLNYRPKRPYEVLNSRFAAWQEERYPGEPVLDWRDAPPQFKEMARKQDPDIAKSEQDWVYDMDRRADEADIQIDQAYSQYETKQAEYDERIALLSARVNAGQMSLEDWRTAYAEINEDRADQSLFLQERLAGMGIDLNKSQAEREQRIAGEAPQVALALTEYRSIRPADFIKMGPDGQPLTRYTDGGPVIDSDIDWTAYREAQDAVLSKYPEWVRTEVQDTLAPTEPMAVRLEQTRADLDTYFDTIPKYVGTSPEESHYIDFIVSSLRGIEQQVRASIPGVTPDRQQVYRLGLSYLVQNGKVTNERQAQLAALAMRFALDSKMAVKARNPASLEWLVTHPDLFRFFSWMETEVPSRLKSLLPADVTATSLPDIESRELRGTDLASVR